MWPRPNPGDVASSNFDSGRFWIHGGPLFFGDELSAAVASGHDVESKMACHCHVTLNSADDDDIRQTVLYHLNLEHATAEIKEMDRLQFPFDFQKRWDHQGRMSAILTMTDMWGPCRDGGVNSRFFVDRTVWKAWLGAAREVVMDWEGFDEWDWDGLADVRYISLDKIAPEVFQKLTHRLLVFFIYTFITRLGYYPSPILHPPLLASHYCIKHPKKFGVGTY
jgi:hypothetical protein